MSAQFGIWSFEGRPIDRSFLDSVRSVISPHGPDSGSSYSEDSISILYHSLNTTKESRHEVQPQHTRTNCVIVWDGRLDNRAELVAKVGISLTATDIEIVASAYERWGIDSFAKILGDWAMSVWNRKTHTLILAKDFVGVRPLYYSMTKDHIAWSTVLDPLVLFSGTKVDLNEEYLAGWLSFYPATHLTPYTGIHSVPASSFVLLRRSEHLIRKYWDFNPGKTIGNLSDAEYEEAFRAVFRESVRRRLRADKPILAELSGGMDSSSVVCMADQVIASGDADTPRLDTISYYSDSEPNWNERPFLSKVEEKRGRAGCHIESTPKEMFKFDLENGQFEAMPRRAFSRNSEMSLRFASFVRSEGHRVVLSGIGGDEVMGGVPTPVPHLQDLIARFRLSDLAHQLKVWALYKRKPWFHLLFEALRGFFPPSLAGVPSVRTPPLWFRPEFIRRNKRAFGGYNDRVRFFGPLPSFQGNVATLEALRRQLACSPIAAEPAFEKRYPYLDRDLVEFIYSIPREQLVRAGQRRSLMRRALAGVVPAAIIERKRKAFVSHGPRVGISSEWATISTLCQQMVGASIGIFDPDTFAKSLQDARFNQEVPLAGIFRTLFLEEWFRNIAPFQILNVGEVTAPGLRSCVAVY